MLTLLEASKMIQNPLQAGVVEIFPKTSPVLEKLPFLTISGNAYNFNREETLPGIGFRDYNETYNESTGVVQNLTENLKIFGGLSKVDRALVKTQGNINDLRAIEDGMKAKAAALDFTKAFFKGDSTTNTKEFDGLQKRLTGSQLIPAGNTAGGDPLTLEKVDILLDTVQGGADMLFMSKSMRRNLNVLMRASGQAFEMVADSFGRQIPAYAGVPIGIIECDSAGTEILDFTEACPAGGTGGASIYAVKFGIKENVSGLQAGELEVIDNGLVGIHYETLIEWICSIAIFSPKAAARLYGIKQA